MGRAVVTHSAREPFDSVGHPRPEHDRVVVAGALEHDDIDPALENVRDAFASMSAHPCTDHRNALEIRLGAAHELLLAHLAHEEKHALPMLQRTLSKEENAAFEKAVEKRYPLRSIPFILPWAMDEVPADARERLLESTPPGYRLLLRIFRRRYERGERLAFRFA